LLLRAFERLTAPAIRKSELGHHELFDHNPFPMWLYDPETLKFLAVNNAAIRHYGYSRKEFLSMTIKDIRPSDDHSSLLQYVAQRHSDKPMASY
jgi:PAS domain S-box-containing protein